MRKGFLGLVALVVFGGTLQAETVEVPSKIASVVVFQDRALVTREAQLELAAGAHEIRFVSLPGSIEPDSITAKGAGKARVQLFGAKLVTTELEDASAPRIKELEAEIEKLNDALKELEDAQKALQEKRDFLTSIRAATGEQIGKDIVTKLPVVDEISKLADYLNRELQAAYTKSNQMEIEKRDAAKQIDRLRRELDKLYGAGRRQQAVIAVELEAKTAGTFTLEVSYRLPGASWEPLYEARSLSDSPDVQINIFGTVRQRTGEDWEDVTVRLSTARPAVSGYMPEMQPWFLQKIEPPRPMQASVPAEARLMKRQKGAAEGYAANDKMAVDDKSVTLGMEEKKDAETAVAAVDAQGPAVVYTLPSRQTVPADWQPRKVAMASQTLPASIAYETTPRLSPHVYLRAKVKNGPQTFLLAGAVQIFLDGAYIGRSWIPVVGPAEEFDLYLGVDERIRVERRPMKAKADVSVLPGLHGRTKTIDYEYLTIVENYLPKQAEVTVVDQIPVSNHDEIKVEQVAMEPSGPEKDEKKPGVCRWVLKIPAGAKQTVKLAYRVKYPADFIVGGL